MSDASRSCEDVLAHEPVNQLRAQIYERLLEAQEQIAHALYRRGVEHKVIEAALDTADEKMTDAERREDLYVSALAHYLEALGGSLEVRALVGDEAVVVRREP